MGRTDRSRHADLEGVVDRTTPAPNAAGATRRLVHVYDGGALTGTLGFIATNPVEVVGDEREGGTASYSVDLKQTTVVLAGPHQAGDILRAHLIANRWVSNDVSGRCAGVYTFGLTGCGGNYPGATMQGVTVEVYDLPPDAGGVLLGSGVLDQNGQVKLSITYPILATRSAILTDDATVPFLLNSRGNGTPEYLRVGMVLLIGTEYMQISAIGDTGQVSVTRGFQGSPIAKIKHETWDTVTPPANPTGWGGDLAIKTTAAPDDGIVPFSAPNCLQLSATGDSKFTDKLWGTKDNANGAVSVTGTFAVGATTDDQSFGVFARCSDNFLVWPTTPIVRATVAPSGGGTTGGKLAAGTYKVAYTWVDPVTHVESGPGNSESVEFTVAAGAIPRVTIAFPQGYTANIYAAGPGPPDGLEYLYATGVSMTTFDLATAVSGAMPAPVNAPSSSFYWASLSPKTQILSLYSVAADYLGGGIQRPLATLPIAANPTTPALVNPIGGGSTGGKLDPGKYYAAYSWTDPNGIESGLGTSESPQFTVVDGNIPSVIAAFPYPTAAIADGWKLNVYLTAAGGDKGSETQYAAGLTKTTMLLATAFNGGTGPQADRPAIVPGIWYRLNLSCFNTTIGVQVQRIVDGAWLNRLGTWQPGVAGAVGVTDTSVGVSGYAGLTLQARADNAYADDWWMGPDPSGTPIYVCGYFVLSGASERFNAPLPWLPVWCGGTGAIHLTASTGYTCFGSECAVPPTTTLSMSGPFGTVELVDGAGTISGINYGGAPGYGTPGKIPCGGCDATGQPLPFGQQTTPIEVTYSATDLPGYYNPGMASLSPSGGGTLEGGLQWGTYFGAYTWIDEETGLETGIGPTPLTGTFVYPGFIPQIGVAMETGDNGRTASSINIYLSRPANSPTAQVAVDPIGGGTTGGKLAPGNYLAAYTWTDPVTGLESGKGASESVSFSVSGGYIPTLKMAFPPWFPAGPISVTPTGGGATGGTLPAGKYYLAFTYVIPGIGETSAGTSESLQFTVAEGNIPSLVVTGPTSDWSANIYLTAANGARGTEVLYAANMPLSYTTSNYIYLSAAPSIDSPSAPPLYPLWKVYLTPANGAAGSEVLYLGPVATPVVMLADAAPPGDPPPPTRGGPGDLVLYQTGITESGMYDLTDLNTGTIPPPPNVLVGGMGWQIIAEDQCPNVDQCAEFAPPCTPEDTGISFPLWIDQCAPGFSAGGLHMIGMPITYPCSPDPGPPETCWYCPPDWKLNGGAGGTWPFTLIESGP